MRKKFMTLLLSFLLLFTSNVALGTGGTTDSDDIVAIKNIISTLFDNHFKSLQTLKVVDSSNLVEDNEQTLLYKNTLEFQVEANKAINLSYTKYNVNLDFINVKISGDKASVNVLMSCDYAYSTTPDQKSALYNFEYNIDLLLTDNQWKIISIDSKSKDYEDFEKEVTEKEKKGLSKRQAVTETKEERLDSVNKAKAYLEGNPQVKPSEEKKSSTFSISAVSVSYNKWLAVNWAERFATASDSSRFFYTAPGNDCTNFVSQCVWAGYGGYVEGNDTKTKSNITNKFRMINGTYTTGWYGGAKGGGGTKKWEQVDALWNYVTPTHSSGPNATGYNNEEPYYNYTPDQIYLGEVLQFRNGSSGAYEHSVIVTYSEDNNNDYYSDILVSQHSDNLWNRNLWELIQNKGGNNCNMRDMTFKSASFAS